MRFAIVLAFVIACGTPTFTSSDDGGGAGDVTNPTEGGGSDGAGNPLCAPPCVQVASIDMPTCLEASAGYLFYATDAASATAGRVDKSTMMTATANLPGAAADCTLWGATLLVALQPGPVVPVNTVTMTIGNPFNSSSSMNKRITSRFLNPGYVAGIRADGLWGCDPMPTCQKFLSPTFTTLTSIVTDGDYIYFSGDSGVARFGTSGAAMAEPIVPTGPVTALATDLNNLIYAVSGDGIYAIGKAPASIKMRIVDKMPNVLWIMTDAGGVYWSTSDSVYGSHKDGGSQNQYARGQPSPIRVITDDSNVYWINHMPKAQGGGIYRTPKK